MTRLPLFPLRIISFNIRPSIPQVSYKLDRPYHWPWFSASVYVFMLIVLMILIPVNYALQGVQVITEYKHDPNTTSSLWFHRFTGYPEPGSSCNEHVFNVGDTFKTNVGFFSYTLGSVSGYASSKDAQSFGGSAVPYKGLSLDWCDVDQVGLDLVSPQNTPMGTARIRCFKDDFQITAYTSIMVDQSVPQSRATILDLATKDPQDPCQYLGTALDDLTAQIDCQYLPSGCPSISTIVRATAEVGSYCPMAVFRDPTLGNLTDDAASGDGECTPSAYTNLPRLEIEDLDVRFDTVATNPAAGWPNLVPFVLNFLQVMTALVRLDLGNQLFNSFLSNTSAVLAMNDTFRVPMTHPINATLKAEAPDGFLLKSIQDSLQNGYLPLQPSHYYGSTSNMPLIATTYECHLTVAKTPGSAIISVIVATLSISSTIWALLMVLASYFAKRNKPEANYCRYHGSEDGIPHLVSNDIEMGDAPTIRADTSGAVSMTPSKDGGESSGIQPSSPLV